MRRILAAFLIILMLCTLLPVNALAADDSALSQSISGALKDVISAIRPQNILTSLRTLIRGIVNVIRNFLPDVDPELPDAPVPYRGAAEDEAYFSDGAFVPVLRFTVASDVHVVDVGTLTQETRLAEIFSYASSLAQASPSGYTGYDLAAFLGDISENGSYLSMSRAKSIMDDNRGAAELLCMLGNHEFRAGDEVAPERFEDIFNMPVRGHITVNGFHFIYLSPDTPKGKDFSDDAVNWLKGELDKAAEDTPNKPIFVFHHQHVSGTVYGSADWGVPTLGETLASYPQVVDFSAHSHFPVNDPRSIWQGAFTAVGTGSLSYYEMGLNGVASAYIYSASGTSGEYARTNAAASDADVFWMVEVDAQGSVRMTAYHLDSGKAIVRYGVRKPWNTSSFTYTDARYETSAEPVFTKSARVSVDARSLSGFRCSFPAATCPDNVESYRIELWKDGELKTTEHRLSLTFYDDPPKSFSVSFSGLGTGKYEVRVYAVSSFGKESVPLTAKIKLPF